MVGTTQLVRGKDRRSDDEVFLGSRSLEWLAREHELQYLPLLLDVVAMLLKEVK